MNTVLSEAAREASRRVQALWMVADFLGPLEMRGLALEAENSDTDTVKIFVTKNGKRVRNPRGIGTGLDAFIYCYVWSHTKDITMGNFNYGLTTGGLIKALEDA